jgi:lysophospholipase
VTAGKVLRRVEGVLTGVDGSRLAYRTWEATDARAALVVVHGLGEHSGRYAGFGESMAASGVSTFALDLPGHGRSGGRRGHVPRFDVFLRQIDRFRDEVDGLTGSCIPLFMLGQSMGGLIALRYLEDYAGRFRGAIIASPWLATALPVPRWKLVAASALTRILPALPFRHGIDPDLLSHDVDIVAAYRADPLVHRTITPRTFSEVSAAMNVVDERSDRLHDPLMFLLGGDDRIVATGRSLRFARALHAADVTIREVPGAFHELLNEPDRAVRYSEIRDWILARA